LNRCSYFVTCFVRRCAEAHVISLVLPCSLAPWQPQHVVVRASHIDRVSIQDFRSPHDNNFCVSAKSSPQLRTEAHSKTRYKLVMQEDENSPWFIFFFRHRVLRLRIVCGNRFGRLLDCGIFSQQTHSHDHLASDIGLSKAKRVKSCCSCSQPCLEPSHSSFCSR